MFVYTRAGLLYKQDQDERFRHRRLWHLAPSCNSLARGGRLRDFGKFHTKICLWDAWWMKNWTDPLSTSANTDRNRKQKKTHLFYICDLRPLWKEVIYSAACLYSCAILKSETKGREKTKQTHDFCAFFFSRAFYKLKALFFFFISGIRSNVKLISLTKEVFCCISKALWIKY